MKATKKEKMRKEKNMPKVGSPKEKMPKGLIIAIAPAQKNKKSMKKRGDGKC